MPDLNAMEYSVFSQNGEDGIIAFLTGGLREPHRRFVEIGTADGRENNTALLLQRGWSGVGVDADAESIWRYAQRIAGTPLAGRIKLSALRAGWHNCDELMRLAGAAAPDFLSLDIDSVDYYVALRLLRHGWRPGVVCCEFNPFLGSRPLTVIYHETFSRYGYDRERGLYYGASIGAWRHLFGGFGYRFCGVESAGVNAFFCRETAFEPGFLDGITALQSAYTRVFVDKYGLPGEELERALLARDDLVFVDVTMDDVEGAAEAASPRPA